jgi:hypothetical protein
MVADGADPRTAAHVLGHASPSISMSIYARVMPGKQKAAMLRQDERLAALESVDFPKGQQRAAAGPPVLEKLRWSRVRVPEGARFCAA